MPQRKQGRVQVPERPNLRPVQVRRSKRLLKKIAEHVMRENEHANAVNEANRGNAARQAAKPPTVARQSAKPAALAKQEQLPAMAKKDEAGESSQAEQAQPVVVDFPRVPVLQIGDLSEAAEPQQAADETDGNDLLDGSVPVVFYHGNI